MVSGPSHKNKSSLLFRFSFLILLLVLVFVRVKHTTERCNFKVEFFSVKLVFLLLKLLRVLNAS